MKMSRVDKKSFAEEYTLTRRVYDDGELVGEVNHEFQTESLQDVLDNMAYFLMGCSFTYVKGLTADTDPS